MNPRYSNFQQSVFVAGDVEQFEQYRDATNGRHPTVELNPENNVWLKHVFEMKEKDVQSRDAVENTDLPMYRNLSADAVDNTFFYMFNKFKKGVFIKIKNGELAVFLPFSKHNFVNEWSSRIRHDPTRFDSMNQFLMYASHRDGSQHNAKFNYNIDEWYANNCLFRNEYPLNERDRNLDPLRDMLQALCAERDIPDIEFFVNRRDFPMLSKKGCEPYDHIFDADNIPLKSHAFAKYAPILSMVTTDRHADIPIPTHEDWARLASEQNILYEPDRRDYRYEFELEWDKKRTCAVFRGASTGCGVTHELEVNTFTFNPRLFVAKLSAEHAKECRESGLPIRLDAGITEWNTRPRKIRKEPYLRTVEVEQLGIDLVSGLSPVEQSRYKYVLNIDGHVSAFRLSLELGMGSVVLLQEHTQGTTNYRMWFHRSLIPYVHYVPVRKDLSDVLEKIEWCIQNDDQCRQIAQNALDFYREFLSRKGVFDYWQYLLVRLKSSTGHYMYNEFSVAQEIERRQTEWIERFHSQRISHATTDWHSISYPFPWNYTAAKDALRLCMNTRGDFAVTLKPIHQSESTLAQKMSVGAIPLLFKSLRVLKPEKQRQQVNETFCGLTCINQLCSEIPNFRYTFGQFHGHVVMEYVEGITWDKFLANCSVEEMMFILMQLSLALLVAQERCGFVHNDLNGWNIVIRQLKKPIEVAYAFRDRVVKVTTSQIPVLIDYGRSHVVFDKCHFGQVHPFKFSPIQDIFCLVVSTLAVFMNTANMDDEFVPLCLDIINFFTMSHFHPAVIRDKSRLIKFLRQYKKYNEMLYAPKHTIERLTPLHFFEHLVGVCKKLNLNVPFVVVNYPNKCDNPYQCGSMTPSGFIASWMQRQNLMAYVDNFDRAFALLPKAPHLICFLSGINECQAHLAGISEFVQKFAKDASPLMVQVSRLQSQLVTVWKTYKAAMPRTCLTTNLPNRQALVIPRYTERTFAIPSRLLTVLQSYMSRPTTFFADLHDMFVKGFLFNRHFELDTDDEVEVVRAHRKLFTFDCTIARMNCANVNTIKWIASIIYPQQMMEIQPFVSNRMFQTYGQVLDFEYNT